jgi:hypothetical protein
MQFLSFFIVLLFCFLSKSQRGGGKREGLAMANDTVQSYRIWGLTQEKKRASVKIY